MFPFYILISEVRRNIFLRENILKLHTDNYVLTKTEMHRRYDKSCQTKKKEKEKKSV